MNKELHSFYQQPRNISKKIRKNLKSLQLNKILTLKNYKSKNNLLPMKIINRIKPSMKKIKNLSCKTL